MQLPLFSDCNAQSAGVVRPRFARGMGRDPEKVKAKKRRHYLKNREKYLAAAARARKPYSQWSEARRLQAIEYKRRKRREQAEAQGRTLKTATPKGQGKYVGPTWEQNARQAWRWWMRNAPNWWMRAYYRALGKPWANPRLTDASAWRIRYWLDPAFRAKEIEKVQILKARRAERIRATDDGTLTGDVIISLFAEATHCPYCHARMRSVDKSLDHVVPLCAGGAHSISNVLVCCKTCNTKKGRTVSAELYNGIKDLGSPETFSSGCQRPAFFD